MNIIGIDPGASGGVAVIPFYDFYRTQVLLFERSEDKYTHKGKYYEHNWN